MNSGATEDLHAVWGFSATDVYAVGAGGTILHYDGAVWSRVPSPTTADLYDVVTHAGAIYAVGAGGVLVTGRP
jgi:hypothetical protein